MCDRNPFAKFVELGANLMDEKSDTRWFEGINTETLDMSQAESCILGQHFEGYSAGVFELGLTLNNAWEYGFNLPYYVDISDTREYAWALLEIAWIDAISKRIAATL